MNRRSTAASVALLSVTVALAAGYCRVFAGWSWFTDMVITAAVCHGIALVGNVRRLPFVVSAPLTTLVGLWVIMVLRLRSTLWFGVPTGRTWTVADRLIGESWQLVGNITPPLSFDSGFGLVALASIVFVAVISDAFTFRAAGRAEALIPSTLVFVVIAAVGEDRLRVPVTALWILASFNTVAMLRRLDSHASSTRGHAGWSITLGTATAAVCAVVAALLAPLLPGARSEALLKNRDRDQQIVNPMVDVRGRLLDRSDIVLFTVKADTPTYWRLTALPSFDGEKWGIPQSELDAAGGELAPIRETLNGDVIVSSFQRYDIEGLAGNLLPSSFEPVQLRSATRSLFYALDPGALVVTGDGVLSTDSYEIVSKIIDPSAVNLNAASVARPPSNEYLAVPDTDEMTRLQILARTITEGAPSPYIQAMMLQNWFRTEFTYSLDVPAGNGTDATLAFIEGRVGYCEQFSSTMALLSRLLGIPARVAIGFTPGDLGSDGTYTVRSQHAHAWPELWFDDIGWVLFEPTPGRGAPNAEYTGIEAQQDESAPVTTTTAPTTTSTPTTDPRTTGTTTTVAGAATPGSSDRGHIPAWVWLIVVLVVWSTSMPSVVRRLASDTSDPLLLAWRRVLAVYSASGITFGRDATPLEIATSIVPKPGLDESLVHDLGVAVTRRIYDPDAEGHQESDVEDLVNRAGRWVRDASRRLDASQRVRLRVDPFFVWRMNR